MRSNDQKILSHIRRNARANLTTISRKTGIPVSTIFDRLKKHKGGLIRKYTALLDFAHLGYMVKLTLLVKTEPDSRESCKHWLLAHPSVNTLQRINNGYDYCITAVFTDLKESEEFVETLETKFPIRQRMMYHIIEDIACEKVLAGIAET